MNIKKALPVTIGITAVALFAVACNSGESSTTGETPLPQQSAPVVVASVNQTSIPVAAPAVLAKTGPVAAAQAVSSVASSGQPQRGSHASIHQRKLRHLGIGRRQRHVGTRSRDAESGSRNHRQNRGGRQSRGRNSDGRDGHIP